MGEMTLRWDGIVAPPDHVPAKGDVPGRTLRTEDEGWIDPGSLAPDPSLVGLLPPAFLLEEGLLPWRRSGAATVVLCAFPRRSVRHLPRLRAALGGPVRLARTEPMVLARALREFAGRPLALRAERLRPAAASCRSLPRSRIAGWAVLGSLTVVAYAPLEPVEALVGVLTVAAVLLLLSAGLRVAAAWAGLRRERPRLSARGARAGARDLPSRAPLPRGRGGGHAPAAPGRAALPARPAGPVPHSRGRRRPHARRWAARSCRPGRAWWRCPRGPCAPSPAPSITP